MRMRIDNTALDSLPPLRLRLHETGSICNRYEIGTDKPCGSLTKVRFGTVRFQGGTMKLT